jgi:hypothetical protein
LKKKYHEGNLHEKEQAHLEKKFMKLHVDDERNCNGK